MAITPRVAAAYSLPIEYGASVQALQPGGPADQGGLREGDIITSMGDRAINEQNNMLGVLMRFEPGQSVQMTVVRGRSELELEVTLGTK